MTFEKHMADSAKMKRTALSLALMGYALLATKDAFSEKESVFAMENLVAWCIVPFDAKKRDPAERAAMVTKIPSTVSRLATAKDPKSCCELSF